MPREVPVELPPSVRTLLGGEADALLEALKCPAPVSVRLNPAKQADGEGVPVPWCADGRYLEERPVFTLDPLLHAGAYYVQEAASMLLGRAVQACGPLPEEAVALDLCAAPGGKSTHLAALLPAPALLVANEPVPARQAILAENVWKWGRPGVVLAQASPEEWASVGPFCDLVVVDAPCSGEGMFRKDPYARAQWGPHLVEGCARRQRDILDSAWHLLKPGGCLIYSTCTWETCENEDQVRRLQERGAEVVDIPVEEAWGMVAAGAGLRCYPHRVRGEGFFMAAVRKPVGAGDGTDVRLAARGVRDVPGLPAPVGRWLHGAGGQAAVVHGDVLHAVDRRWHGLVQGLAATVRITAPGTPVAVPKGAEWSPHPALALNTLCNHGAFAVLDMDRGQALRYLRGEAVPGQGAAGTALVRHGGLGLGWAQGAGNRWNNRWPVPWRIRMR